MNRRSYKGASDLKLVQDFSAAAIAETDGCGYIHPGNIPHRLFNGNRYFDPAKVMTIWEDDAGVAAWLLVGPRHKSYDAQVRPDLRSNGFEKKVLEYADERTVELMQRHNIKGDRFYGDAYRCDTVRSNLLIDLGWELKERSFFIQNRIKLANLSRPVLPEGYTIRAARGIKDAAALAELKVAAFGSEWTADMVRYVIESPGYAPEREFIIQAPDGTLVAYTVTWHDRLNRTGLFEPVGTHKDYRRLGLGRAVVQYGMLHMAAKGMEFATVDNASDNKASRELYKPAVSNPGTRWTNIQNSFPLSRQTVFFTPEILFGMRATAFSSLLPGQKAEFRSNDLCPHAFFGARGLVEIAS